MRIVFLDIDGVLNPGMGDLAPHMVKALNRITDVSGAKIIVHSSRRYNSSAWELRRMLQQAGVTGEILGTAPTPTFVEDPESHFFVVTNEEMARFNQGLPPKWDFERAAAIQQWLDLHLEVGPKDYVILDDTHEMGHLHARFLRTDSHEGLTEAFADKAIEMLA